MYTCHDIIPVDKAHRLESPVLVREAGSPALSPAFFLSRLKLESLISTMSNTMKEQMIRVSKETWKRLNGQKEPGDSFDDVINKLIDQQEKENDEST